MASGKSSETETHHNQRITPGAAWYSESAMTEGGAEPTQPTKPEAGPAKSSRKVIALQLNPVEKAALEYLGGLPALKKLLCPPGICIRCRNQPAEVGTALDSLCGACDRSETKSP